MSDSCIDPHRRGRFEAGGIEARLFADGARLAAPELLDIEVLHPLRKLDAADAAPGRRQARLLEDFRALPIRRFRHAPLWQDVWALRRNLTCYDACYVALARRLRGTLVTRDERLAGAPALGVPVTAP